MNLLKNSNKFEQKLREQFEIFEAKPNEALWDNIASNLPNDSFEKKVASKLNTLQFEPNKNIWLAIEKRLPFIVKVNKKRIYIWTFVVLIFGVFAGFFINILFNKNNISNSEFIHPKAFVWFNDNVQLSKGNRQITISNKQLAIGNKQIANSNRQFTIYNKQIDANKMQKSSNTLLIAASTMLKALAAMHKVTNNSALALNNIMLENESVVTKEIKLLPEPAKDSVIENTPLAKIDSILISSKNKAILAQQVSHEDYIGPSLKKEKYTFIAYAGLGYSFMRYAPGNNEINSAANINLRNNTESAAADITGGFLIGYDLTKRITISSGIILANFKQTMNFNTDSAKVPINYEEGLIYYKDTILSGSSNSKLLSYSYTEVPIFISYKLFERPKFEMAIQTGLGIGFLTGINTYIINTNNVGVYAVTNKDDFPAFKNTLFFSFQPQFTYNLNSPGVSVGLMPIIKTSLTNIVSDENWLKQYPYNVSMNVFLRKRF